MAEINMKTVDKENHKRRKSSQLRAGSKISMRLKGKKSFSSQMEPVADKYFGAFKVTKWPEDLDEIILAVYNNQ
jgi:hypothetical protein